MWMSVFIHPSLISHQEGGFQFRLVCPVTCADPPIVMPSYCHATLQSTLTSKQIDRHSAHVRGNWPARPVRGRR